MFFSLLGSLTGMWLIFTPLLWPENVGRAALAGAAGLVAIGFGALGIASPRARLVVAATGLALGLSNFVLSGGLGAMASFAVSGLGLIAAGLGPTPHVVPAPAVLLARPAKPIAEPASETTAAAA